MTDVADVLDALVALWTPVAPTGWVVIDAGPPIDPPLNWLCVGFDRADQAAVAVSSGEQKSPALQNRESYDISSLLSSWDGTQHPAVVRRALIAAFVGFRNALRADRRLGGLVTDAVITPGYELDQDPATFGEVATITFTTHVDVF